jgi:citronellol/citronellal dehydrogenase
MELKEKVAIVTGASRGLGKAIGFAAQGAHVVVAARSEIESNKNLPGTITQTVSKIIDAGGKAMAVRCDVTKEQSIQEMVDKTKKTFGRIDVLINNAGVAFYYPVVETPLSQWDIVLKANLNGTFLCSKAVLPTMIRQQNGSIINISSLAADERD